MFLLLLACAPVDDTDPGGQTTDSGDDQPPAAGQWDDPPATLDCNDGAAAPLYDLALGDAEIDRADVGFTTKLWDGLYPYVGGPFQLPFFEDVHHQPEYAACFSRQASTDSTAVLADHPVAAAIGALLPYAGLTIEGDLQATELSLEQALEDLVDAAGGGDDPSAASEVPADLAAALVPVVVAITEGIEARLAMDEAVEAAGVGKARTMFSGAAGLVAYGSSYKPDITDATEVDAFATWFTGDEGPRSLVLPARRIAYAIEAADLGQFAGGDTSWSFQTDMGNITVAGSGIDTISVPEAGSLLHLDLGGDDLYLGGAGANLNSDNPVSVNIDLGGSDTYAYEEVPDSHDGAGMLVSDEDGRSNSSGYYVSSSDQDRQGAGRYGIGMLFDLGGSSDSYASLRMSQGFGALGVGVLYDNGGDDSYVAESAVQGSAVFGYGLLIDTAGNDTYTAWSFAQGFGYTGSVGALVDVAGDDIYWSDPGNSFGGTTLYASPQLPGGEGNSSFSQGAGFGLRGDSWSQWFSGGFGFLSDLAGNDAYSVGVFGQGTGYWEGTGLLFDAGGDDSYDALYYVQGGSAHFATGLFYDASGNDRYNQGYDSYYMQTGAGHDFSLGLFVDDAGDDLYGYGGLAVGASNCQGVGVFVDRDGSDTYDARSTYSTGLGNHSGECESRDSYPSVGIFLDDGGDADTYIWTEGDVRTPADDSVFGIEWSATSDEHGGAADGSGGAGF